MNQILTPAQVTQFRKILARCNDCLPLIEFLEKLGWDVEDLRKRYDHQRETASLALELVGVSQGK